MLLGLAMDFCEAVNAEDAPKIESSVGRVVLQETRVIHDDCYFELQTILSEKIGYEDLFSDKEFNQIVNDSMKDAI